MRATLISVVCSVAVLAAGCARSSAVPRPYAPFEQLKGPEASATRSLTASESTGQQLPPFTCKFTAPFHNPVQGTATVISPYGNLRYQPGRKPHPWYAHTGVDISYPINQPVLAAQDGKVSYVDSTGKGDYGIWLAIAKANVQSLYAHLSQVSVKKGDQVKIGDQVGLSGTTGRGGAGFLNRDPAPVM